MPQRRFAFLVRVTLTRCLRTARVSLTAVFATEPCPYRATARADLHVLDPH